MLPPSSSNPAEKTDDGAAYPCRSQIAGGNEMQTAEAAPHTSAGKSFRFRGFSPRNAAGAGADRGT